MTIHILEDMMKAVVEDGTGSEAAGSGYWAAGKTGSAERSKDKATDAWFVGYAVSEEDSSQCIAVSIVVEEAGGGGSVAAPIARDIFEAYFE